MTSPADPRTPRTAPRTKRGQWLLKELHGLVRGGWTPFREEQWTGTILTIEAEAAAAPDSLREALEECVEALGFVAVNVDWAYATQADAIEPMAGQALADGRAALAAPADKASEPPRAVELLRRTTDALVNDKDGACDLCDAIADSADHEQSDCLVAVARSFLQDSAGADPPAAGLDVERLARILEKHQDGLLHGTLESPREVAEVIAAEYARLSSSQQSEG